MSSYCVLECCSAEVLRKRKAGRNVRRVEVDKMDRSEAGNVTVLRKVLEGRLLGMERKLLQRGPPKATLGFWPQLYDSFLQKISMRWKTKILEMKQKEGNAKGAGRVKKICVGKTASYNGVIISRRILVSASNVAPLPKAFNEDNPLSQVCDWKPLPPNTRVLAMYPNTTSFYNATVIVSRKQVRFVLLIYFVCCFHEASLSNSIVS